MELTKKNKLRFLKPLIFSIFLLVIGAIVMELSRDFIKSSVFFGKSLLKVEQSEQLTSNDSSSRKIQSVNYPLILNEYDLSTTTFLGGAGSIGTLCGALIILDRSGTFFSLKNNKLLSFFSINNRFSYFALKYQSDNYDMLRAHNFTSNKDNVFLSYTRFNEDQSFSHVVSRYPYSCNNQNRLFEEEVLWERNLSEIQASNTQSAGGALLLDSDSLYTSFGFVNSADWADHDRYDEALKSNTGIVLKINLESLKVENFTSGHRNITSIVKRKGDLISLEHGVKGGDEINNLNAGLNYGFPYKTYGTNYSSFVKPATAKTHEEDAKFKDPSWAFVPSIAPGDALYLEESNLSRWNDSLIIGGLKSRSIFVGKFSNNQLVYMEPIFIGERIRSLIYFDNKIYLLTDSAKILTLEIDLLTWNSDMGGSGLVALSPHLKKCVICHSLQPSAGKDAPHLFGILKRPIASIDFEYSKNFSALKNQAWSKELLLKYLKNPGSVVKNSSMPAIGLNPIEAENIYLELLKL